ARQAVFACESLPACWACNFSRPNRSVTTNAAMIDTRLMSAPPADPRLIGPRSGERPPLAILPTDERLGLGRIAGVQPGGIPLQLLPGTIGDIPQVVGLGQPPGIGEGTGRRLARLAGVNPLRVMAQRLGDERLGPLEVLEILLRQQD